MMKRDRIIVLLQPYKNRLMPRRELVGAVGGFAAALSDVCAAYPRLRFNVALPGYILECVDRRVIERLAGGRVEWLCMGYTEPFISFSPLWLTGENIALGARVFSELTGEAPVGFVPPFSNWEPSCIDMLRGAGFKYAALSSALPGEGPGGGGAGYWVTESAGNQMAVFTARPLDRRDAPQDVAGWLKEGLESGPGPGGGQRMLILRYMYSLEPPAAGGRRRAGKPGGGADPQREWLERAAAEIDKRILELQPTRFKDAVGDAPPLGLCYFPPGLAHPGAQPTPYFLNRLHCHDQVSVLQRKLMDAGDGVAALKGVKPAHAAQLTRELLFAQDINRFLPRDGYGFTDMPDRLRSYARLIDIESEIYGRGGAKGGTVSLSGFLRNGNKSVVMANRSLKLYIDHKNGGQVYELDYIDRSFNACAAYNRAIRQSPEVIDPVESKLAFRDKLFIAQPAYANYKTAADVGNFSRLPMEYAFKGTQGGGARVMLSAAGAFAQADGKQTPLAVDKVFGLEKDTPVLTYSYKLGNPTTTPYSLTLAIEMPLALPGVAAGLAKLKVGGQPFNLSEDAEITADDATMWAVDDEWVGVRMEFVTQKKVSLWAFTDDAESASAKIKGAHGTTFVMAVPMEIGPISTQSFTGRISFRKIRVRGGIGNDSV
jgi:hypothetical protein